MKRVLPSTVTSYAQSPTFTHETVPESLLKCHNLKSGTWGHLRVEEGEITFYLDEEAEPVGIVRAGETFVILPEERHYIRVSNDARFFIEFHK